MDPLTHGLLGALLAGALGVHLKYGNAATAILVLASIAPDLDALAIVFGPQRYFQCHRSLFHSVSGAAVLALAVAAVAYAVTPAKDFPLLLALASAGMALHLAVDLLSSWPIPLFAPFAHRRICFDITWFISLTILLIAAGALVWMLADPPNAQPIAAAGLAVIALYIAFRWYQRRQIMRFARDERYSPDAVAPLAVIPPQLAFFTWHALVPEGQGFAVHDIHFCLAPRGWHTETGGPAGTRVLSSQHLASSPDASQVAATKAADLVRIFLERARFPVATVHRHAGGNTVVWDDVHLMLSGGAIRGVILETDPAGRILRQRFKLKPELEAQDRTST